MWQKMSSFDDLTTRVAHALWAPADMHYLATAINRLCDLTTLVPELPAAIGLSHEELSKFSVLLQAEAMSHPNRLPELNVINAPLLDESISKHPFHRYRLQHAGYVILLTSLPTDHALKASCDVLTARVLIETVRLNLSKSFDDYTATLALATKLQLTGGSLNDDHRQPSSYYLNQVCLPLRAFVDAASSQIATDQAQLLFEKFEKKAEAFIKAPTRVKKPRSVTTKSSASKQKPKSKRHRDTKSLLNLPEPRQLQVIRQALHVEELVEYVKVTISAAVSKAAKRLDCSPLELISEQPTISQEIPQDHSRHTSVAVGRFQAKLLSNRNEHLRLDVVNLTPKQVADCTKLLRGISAKTGELGLGASFLLLSLVTGRSHDVLPNATVLDSNATTFDELSLLKTVKDLESIKVVLLPAIGCLALRVNLPKVAKISEWQGAIPRRAFVLVPDYLQVSLVFKRQLEGLGVEPNQLPEIHKDLVEKAISRVGLSLKAYGVSPKRLWQTLPRLLQSESGMNTAMAMLTDWQTSNSEVDLHYHCVDSQKLVNRYRAGMDAMLHYDASYLKLESQLPTQKHFVGSPNCISAKKLTSLIDQIEKLLLNKSDRIQHANLLTLYTLMVMTAGFGFRHAISPTIELHRLRSRVLLSYVEKNELRQVVLPKLVQEQLAAYEKMRAMPLTIGTRDESSSELSFYLIDRSCRKRAFHPGSFSAELKAFGLEFELELNSLRRWMFSALFNEGVRGIKTDFFGGHGVMGREPLTSFSSTTFDSFLGIADEMDRVLKETGWKVLQ